MIANARDVVRWLPGRWHTAGVTERTWRRWMSGTAPIPLAIVLLARILVNGDLSVIDPEWTGWFLARGKLWDSESGDQWHTPGTVRVWWWTAQQLDAHRALRKQTHRRLDEARTSRDSRASKADTRSPYATADTAASPQRST